jgi:signal transduction histidine kinase
MSAALATCTVPAGPAKARVLVLDDEAPILRLFRRALADYEVHTALTPEEALERLEASRIELVFVDKNLPGMDGIEFLRRARAGAQRFEAVVMTGYPSLDSAIDAVDLKVFRYLRKPLDLDEIDAAAAQAVERLRATERREAEFKDAIDQLILSEQRRGVSERLAAIGQMAATLTHEIANPLCYLESCLQGLQEAFATVEPPAREQQLRETDPDAARRLGDALADIPVLLGDSADASGRLKRLVREARGMGRPIDRREPVDVRAVVEDALRIAGQRIPPHVRVTIEGGDLPPVHADPIKLAQVVANLVVNGADAVPADTPREARVAVRLTHDEDSVVIEVEDTGSGIDPLARDRLFTPFFTTKAGRGGTGIGLSVCRDIVRAHGGFIDIHSEPGRGSVFRVRLPRRAPVETESRGGPARVLWIDGDRRLLALMLRAFADRHTVVPATSGREALALLQADRRFDLVLCDLATAGTNLASLWEQARAMDPVLAERFVFLRGESSPPGAADFVDGLDARTLSKPVAIDDVERLLQEFEAR